MKSAFRKKASGVSAFTVLELMISVALIGILAVLMFVSFKAVSATRVNTRCVNNLRQTGTAMLIYIADSQQTLRSFHGGAVVDEIWSRKLFYGGYLNPDVSGTGENAILLNQIDTVGHLLRCPSGAIEATYKTDSPEVRSNPRRWPWQTYGLGMYQADTPIKTTTVNNKNTYSFEVKLAKIEEPARYILFADSSGIGPNFYQSFRISRTAGEGGVCLRHNGRANAFFLDGHIEAIDRDGAKRANVPDGSIYSPTP